MVYSSFSGLFQFIWFNPDYLVYSSLSGLFQFIRFISVYLVYSSLFGLFQYFWLIPVYLVYSSLSGLFQFVWYIPVYLVHFSLSGIFQFIWFIPVYLVYSSLSGLWVFRNVTWPVTDTECQVWTKSTKLSFLTVHIFLFTSNEKKRPQHFILNNQCFNLTILIFYDSLFYFRTFQYFEANYTHFRCRSFFGTCSVFVPLRRFESMILHTSWSHFGNQIYVDSNIGIEISNNVLSEYS